MSNVHCPYCDIEQEIANEDNSRYEPDRRHIHACHTCEKNFVYTTEILVEHTSFKADCLNDGQHDWEKTRTYPRHYTKWECKDCEQTRDLTEVEMTAFLSETERRT